MFILSSVYSTSKEMQQTRSGPHSRRCGSLEGYLPRTLSGFAPETLQAYARPLLEISGLPFYAAVRWLQVPIVVRGPGGVGKQLGAEHSQRLESYFQSIPGVQIVACSTVPNSKALLKAAIRSDNPVRLP